VEERVVHQKAPVVTHDQAAEASEPCNRALHDPTSLVPTERSAILFPRPGAVAAISCLQALTKLSTIHAGKDSS
jgi:hypothetical protein